MSCLLCLAQCPEVKSLLLMHPFRILRSCAKKHAHSPLCYLQILILQKPSYFQKASSSYRSHDRGWITPGESYWPPSCISVEQVLDL